MKQVEFEVFLDQQRNERMRVRLQVEKGQPTYVVFQYESLLFEEWHPIVRYDCAHGFFHRDVLWPNGTQEKTKIVIDNLKDASRYAEQDIKDRWEWYRERYLKKLKKR